MKFTKVSRSYGNTIQIEFRTANGGTVKQWPKVEVSMEAAVEDGEDPVTVSKAMDTLLRMEAERTFNEIRAELIKTNQ